MKIFKRGPKHLECLAILYFRLMLSRNRNRYYSQMGTNKLPWTDLSKQLLQELKDLPYFKNRKEWDELFDILIQYEEDGGSDPKIINLIESFIEKRFQPTAKPLSKTTIVTLDWLDKNLKILAEMQAKDHPQFWMTGKEEAIRHKLSHILIDQSAITTPMNINQIRSLIEQFLLDSAELQSEVDWIWIRMNKIAKNIPILGQIRHDIVLDAFIKLFTSSNPYNFLMAEGQKHNFLYQAIIDSRKAYLTKSNSVKNEVITIPIHEKKVEDEIIKRQIEGSLERFLTEREVRDGKKKYKKKT